jgi:hypothetical protein
MMKLKSQITNQSIYFALRILLKFALGALLIIGTIEITKSNATTQHAIESDQQMSQLEKKVTAAVISRQLEATNMEPMLASEQARREAFDYYNSILDKEFNESERVKLKNLYEAIRFRFDTQDELYVNSKFVDGNIQFTEQLRLKSSRSQSELAEKFYDFKYYENSLILQFYSELLSWQWIVIYVSAFILILSILISIIDYRATRCALLRAQNIADKLRDGILNNQSTDVLLVPVKEINDLITYIESNRKLIGGIE